MTDGKHTPGPWRVEGNQERAFHISTDNVMVGPYVVAGGIVACDIEHEPNARLIAAAPEMLEALREMLATYCDHGRSVHGGAKFCRDTTHDRARAALAKATGKEE